MQPPANSTLQESTVLDLSVGYEVWPTLSLKLLYGMWDIADRPNSSWSATNELQMRPIMLLAQFAWNPKGASGRWYAGIGGGYSVATSYQVSGRYESLLGSSYEVEADNSWVWQAVAGGEVFGSSDLKINIGFELGYAATITDIEWTRTLDGVVSSDSGGLMFYFFRTYLSLPF